jgi:hypothetical protein
LDEFLHADRKDGDSVFVLFDLFRDSYNHG